MEMIKGMTRKEYNHKYYKNNPDKWKQYAERKKGKYIYIIRRCEDNHLVEYVGSTTNLYNRVLYHKANKDNSQITNILNEGKSYEVKALDLTSLNLTEVELKDVEQYYINLYSAINPNIKNDLVRDYKNYNEEIAIEVINNAREQGIKWQIYDFKFISDLAFVFGIEEEIHNTENDKRAIRLANIIKAQGRVISPSYY